MNTKSEAALEGAEGISRLRKENNYYYLGPWFQNSNEASANTTLIQS